MMFIKIFIFTLAISLSLASCAGSEPATSSDPQLSESEESTPVAEATMPDPTATGIPTATPTAVPEPTAAEITASPTAEEQMTAKPEPTPLLIQPGTKNISITGAEDLPIQTTLYMPGGSGPMPGPLPGIILLHMLGSDRQIWDDNGFANTLVDNGYAVLAVDLRGHGETRASIDWTLAPEDLRLVWEYFTALEVVDAQRTAVIGASIGANLALLTSAGQPAIRTAVLLSPGLDYRGVTTEDPLQEYGARPILIVASEEDAYASDSSRALADLAQGESQLEMYNGAGHGTRMFDAQPDLSTLIITWLAQNLN